MEISTLAWIGHAPWAILSEVQTHSQPYAAFRILVLQMSFYGFE